MFLTSVSENYLVSVLHGAGQLLTPVNSPGCCNDISLFILFSLRNSVSDLATHVVYCFSTCFLLV